MPDKSPAETCQNCGLCQERRKREQQEKLKKLSLAELGARGVEPQTNIELRTHRPVLITTKR